MSNAQDEIKEILAKLRQIQISETELLQRLEQLSVSDTTTLGSPSTTRTQTTREFRIGDLVQVKNPKPFQIKKGHIIRIGADTNRITVQSKNGSKIVRAPSNLIHIN
jgi:hypothetical protein